ncbi:MAG: VOC family protein [Cyanobacteria bacterium P01_G01_bin.19]
MVFEDEILELAKIAIANILKIQVMKFQYTHTRLYVRDCRACYHFYHDILGLEATFASEIDSYVELTDGNVKISLLNQNIIKDYLGTKTNFQFESQSDRIAVSFQVKDVEEACEYLKKQGVEVVSPPWNVVDWGIKLAFVRDPEGNLVELSQMGSMLGAE